jgi:hypothetical protein
MQSAPPHSKFRKQYLVSGSARSSAFHELEKQLKRLATHLIDVLADTCQPDQLRRREFRIIESRHRHIVWDREPVPDNFLQRSDRD